MSLVARNLSYTYQSDSSLSYEALKSVSLTVEDGSATLLAGATGSGKSTLLRLLAGLLQPTDGTVELNGAPPVAGTVGIVFQQPETQLFAETVLDDVMFGPKNLGMSEDEARNTAIDALKLVGLDPDVFADRSPFALSGGEARKAAIAGVIAMKPATLLLDEPTAGLDWDGREAVFSLVRELKAQGVGIVVVSHVAEDFLPLIDNALLLKGGEEVFNGSVDAIIANPTAFEDAGILMPPLLKLQLEVALRDISVGPLRTEVDQVSHALLTARKQCVDGVGQ